MTKPLFLALFLTAVAEAGDDGAKSGVILDPAPVMLERPAARQPSWTISLGAMARTIGRTETSSTLTAADLRSEPLGVGPRTAFANRTYDDNAFVNIGTGTINSGFTSFFGYQNTPVVSNNSFSLQRSGGVQIASPFSQRAKDEATISPVLELTYLRPIYQDVDFGVTTAFSWLELDQGLGQNLAQQSLITTDTFAVGSTILPLGPYQGPQTIGLPGAPLIPNRPAGREINGTATGFQQSTFDLDFDLYTLALGPEIRFHIAKGGTLSLSGGVTFSYLDWQAHTANPTIDRTNNSVSSAATSQSDDDFLWGGFAKASIGYPLTERLRLELFGRYDWSEDFSGDLGSTTFETSLSGYSGGASLSFRF